ncbi:hypothetical protein HHI36_023338 [Cryptolaemus montrouzieri]|uniref:Uncharacterized protein n=1 Tax=Cryptolaemus montrouzieri TaxID=559131 RepID=A0ABD2PHR3_9CUCU
MWNNSSESKLLGKGDVIFIKKGCYIHEKRDVIFINEGSPDSEKKVVGNNEDIEDILKVIGSENINPQINVETEELENEISHEDIASENEIMYEDGKSVEENSEDDTGYGSVEEQENKRRLRKIPKWLADYETRN